MKNLFINVNKTNLYYMTHAITLNYNFNYISFIK